MTQRVPRPGARESRERTPAARKSRRHTPLARKPLARTPRPPAGNGAPAAPARPITYKDAGVDIAATDRFVTELPGIIGATHDGRVLGDLRGFAALYRLDVAGMEEPILVTTTDGVGTKLRVAIDAGRHETIGIDLVAMCANDLICCGARPLVFLDYYATARFDAPTARRLLAGVAQGCRQAGLALVGGETAVMPGMYRGEDYDLAGFAAGLVDRRAMIDTGSIRPGDVAIGLASSGLHSNGYSLARRVLLDQARLPLDTSHEALGRPLVDELLEPTRIYVDAVRRARSVATIKGIAHITGGGLPGNSVRLLSPGLRLSIERGRWPVPPVFGLIQELGHVPQADMFSTFNMGIGLVLVVAREDAGEIMKIFPGDAWAIGSVREGEVGVDVE